MSSQNEKYHDERSSSSDTEELLTREEISFKSKGHVRLTLLLAANCIFFLLNGAFMFLNVLKARYPIEKSVVLPSHDFTKDAVRWEIQVQDDIFGEHESPFRGMPRPELDKAWMNLLKGYNVRVPSPGWQKASLSNRTLVELTDGSGDLMATPMFMHEIHCLRNLREYLMPEHYPETYERFKPSTPGGMSVHMDHCIDALRQSAMCHADMTLMMYEWWDTIEYPQPVIHSEHVCANWEQLSGWAKDRAFHPWNEILMNPYTGKAPYPVTDTAGGHAGHGD